MVVVFCSCGAKKCKCTSLSSSGQPASRWYEGSLFSQVQGTHPLICLFSHTLPSSVCNNPPPRMQWSASLTDTVLSVCISYGQTQRETRFTQRRGSLKEKYSDAMVQYSSRKLRKLQRCRARRFVFCWCGSGGWRAPVTCLKENKI